MLGVFVSIDLFLFYIFWDAMLIPMYFLIGIWGYERRIYAAIKFMLYTMAGSVLMLIAIIGLAWAHAETSASRLPSFNLLDLYGLQLSPQMESWFFLAFALAFAIKVPLFPFHTWLPDAHVEAPTAGSIILAGVLLKMGTYGLLRFAFPLFPAAALAMAPIIATAGGHRHHLRRARRHGAARHEEAGRVLERQPPRLRRARALRDEPAGRAGLDLSDAEPRRQHGRALHDRRHAVRSPSHPPHLGVRRPQVGHAAPRRRVPARDAVLDRPAGPQRVRRRVPDPRRRLPVEPEADGRSRRPASSSRRSTCSGCSSA